MRAEALRDSREGSLWSRATGVDAETVTAILGEESIRYGRTWQGCADGPPPSPTDCCPARPAVFLDRDGTLIEDKPYNSNPDDIVLLPGVLEGLEILRDLGYLLVVVTNQSGVARGRYDGAAVSRMHQRLNEAFAPVGVRIAAYYYCPHHPDGVVPELAHPCPFRKPGPGLLLRAASDWDIDLATSWMLGDQPTDAGAARAAGCRPRLVGGCPPPRRHPASRASSLLAAARSIRALGGLARPDSPAALRRAPRR